MGILSSLIDHVENVNFNEFTDQESVYKIINKKTHKVLFGEYGKFKNCLIGNTKEFIDEFPLYFETTVHAKYYLKKYIDFYNAFEDSNLTESDFEILETEYESSGLVLTFDIIWAKKQEE